MLSTLVQGSPATLIFLGLCLLLALVFEFSNGFHDTANAVATVIYTKSLKPQAAVVWSGIMNFVGVIVGGVAVAYALVELIPPDVLSPPNGGIAVGMLGSLFISALVWNIGTWWFGIPNSSSHALIGALIGIAIENSLSHGRGLGGGVDWHQIGLVLSSLLVSPLLGFALALALFQVAKHLIHDKNLFEPPKDETPPVWWMRGLLILTCTGVSFAHGTNDGQKSIGLIMLTIIGLLPGMYALNTNISPEDLKSLVRDIPAITQFIDRYGDEQRALGVQAAHSLAQSLSKVQSINEIPDKERSALRNDINRLLVELKSATGNKDIDKVDEKQAKAIHERWMKTAQYAPWWVRVLSALCLGVGTMIGYKRIVQTLGERLGNQHLAPAQGAAAEVVATGLIAFAGISGYPVSTTHVVTGGIAGTMVGSGAGVQKSTLWQIAAAWVLTMPATILISGGLFYLLS
jgi:inorganic phosphate transporter, PiT family